MSTREYVPEPVVWPTVDELRQLEDRLNVLADGLQAKQTAGGTAERWKAIEMLRSASRSVFAAAVYVYTAADNPERGV